MFATRMGYPWFEDRFCREPFRSMYIAVDGRASVCCGAANENFGDLTKQTVREVFEGFHYRRLRAAMAVGAHTSYCRMCDLPFGLAGGNPRDAVGD